MTIDPKRIRAMVAAAILALATCLIGVPVAASGASGPAGEPEASSKWAWITVRNPNDSYTPPAKDRGNSAGATNSVAHLGTGDYVVTLRDVGAGIGVILISTFGTKPRLCGVGNWFMTNDDQTLGILCYGLDGAPANARFVVDWLAAEGIGGRLAYGWVAEPTNASCTSATFPYHSMGESVNTCFELPFSVTKLASLGSAKGIVQVSPTTRRQGVGGASPGSCDVESFFPAASPPTVDEHIRTLCYNANGVAQTDRTYHVAFMQGLGMKGIDRTGVAYVLADQPRSDSYLPDPDHSYSSAGGTNRVTRQGLGEYTVILPGMPLGGSAQVTPVGASKRLCAVSSIRKTGDQQRVGVRCWNLSGDPANATFALSFAR